MWQTHLISRQRLLWSNSVIGESIFPCSPKIFSEFFGSYCLRWGSPDFLISRTRFTVHQAEVFKSLMKTHCRMRSIEHFQSIIPGWFEHTEEEEKEGCNRIDEDLKLTLGRTSMMMVHSKSITTNCGAGVLESPEKNLNSQECVSTSGEIFLNALQNFIW